MPGLVLTGILVSESHPAVSTSFHQGNRPYVSGEESAEQRLSCGRWVKDSEFISFNGDASAWLLTRRSYVAGNFSVQRSAPRPRDDAAVLSCSWPRPIISRPFNVGHMTSREGNPAGVLNLEPIRVDTVLYFEGERLSVSWEQRQEPRLTNGDWHFWDAISAEVVNPVKYF